MKTHKVNPKDKKFTFYLVGMIGVFISFEVNLNAINCYTETSNSLAIFAGTTLFIDYCH